MRRVVKHTANSIEVYHLAVDGRAHDVGFTMPEIAKMTDLNVETVRLILKQHVKDGYVVRNPRSKNPIFFNRGPLAGVMDEVVSNTKTKSPDGRIVNPKNCREHQAQENLTIVHTQRTHLYGRVRFDVIKIGDMSEIRTPDGVGGYTKIPLFPDLPYRKYHNSQSWKATIQSEGVPVNIDLFESKKHTILAVFPPEQELTQDQLASAEDFLKNRASVAVAILTKYGGWKLGVPVLIGTVEYADSDSPLLPILQKMTKYKNSRLWGDHSHGTSEGETKDLICAEWLSNFERKANQIQSQLIIHDERIASAEESLIIVAEILDKQIQLKQLEIEAVKVSSGNNQTKTTIEESGASDFVKKDSRRENEVMYR